MNLWSKHVNICLQELRIFYRTFRNVLYYTNRYSYDIHFSSTRDMMKDRYYPNILLLETTLFEFVKLIKK